MKKILLSLVTLFAAATSAFAGDIITNGGFESWTDGACDDWKSTTSASNCKITQSADAHIALYKFPKERIIIIVWGLKNTD